MSKSLSVINGDLQIGSGRSYQSVSGSAKLSQDLTLWIQEHVGTDSMTPTYGSTLDGGIIDGNVVPSFIGQINTAERVSEVRANIASLLGTYQQMQLEKMKREIVEYQGRHTLDPDEILNFVDSIEAKAVGDQIIVRVLCTTMSMRQFKLTLPVAV